MQLARAGPQYVGFFVFQTYTQMTEYGPVLRGFAPVVVLGGPNVAEAAVATGSGVDAVAAVMAQQLATTASELEEEEEEVWQPPPEEEEEGEEEDWLEDEV